MADANTVEVIFGVTNFLFGDHIKHDINTISKPYYDKVKEKLIEIISEIPLPESFLIKGNDELMDRSHPLELADDLEKLQHQGIELAGDGSGIPGPLAQQPTTEKNVETPHPVQVAILEAGSLQIRADLMTDAQREAFQDKHDAGLRQAQQVDDDTQSKTSSKLVSQNNKELIEDQQYRLDH